MTTLDIDRIRAEFRNRSIHYYPTIDSTMRAAARCKLGDVVIAGEQTAGQGRHGHTWYSEPATGIYCSMVLAPAPALTLALGLAAASAISEIAGVSCDLRWPNDVLLDGRKVAGVLVQLSGAVAIAGIGINANHRTLPPELDAVATSLRIHTAREVSTTDLLIALLHSADRFAAEGRETILRLFTAASSYAAGRRVRVNQPEGLIEGTTAGLDPSGFLIVRKDDGTDTLIVAGGVRAAGS
ncbi:MAG TPA: biotin--[acetyl-CoA-carboxylase] ligase [Bryobacteraceae bacterium]|nr:biotin--[acetyl-CoA-carboxylase] ligase [Bryobacteraceae bacterium]